MAVQDHHPKKKKRQIDVNRQSLAKTITPKPSEIFSNSESAESQSKQPFFQLLQETNDRTKGLHLYRLQPCVRCHGIGTAQTHQQWLADHTWRRVAWCLSHTTGNLTWLKPPTYSEIFIWAWQSPTNSQKVPHQILKTYRCMWWNISWHSGWWYTYPSETYESQVGWLFPINGTIKAMFQNTNQINMWCIDMYSVSCDFDSDYQSPWKSPWKSPLIIIQYH